MNLRKRLKKCRFLKIDVMKVLKEFKCKLQKVFNPFEVDGFQRLINKHYLGDENCNKYLNGELVAKYPEKETEDYKNANFNCCKGFSQEVTLQLLENGSFRIKN